MKQIKYAITFLIILTNFQLMAQLSLSRSLDKLTSEIVHAIPEEFNKIAVTDFSGLFGQTTDFSKFVSEELTTRLFMGNKFDEIVERRLLQRILKEQRLSRSALMDRQSMKMLGRIYAVDAIITGTITDLTSRLRVNARAIATETGEVVGAASVYIEKTDKVRKLLGEEVPGYLMVASEEPGAEVYVDDISQGMTTQRKLKLPLSPGFRNIMVQRKEYKDFQKKVLINEGAQKDLKVKFVDKSVPIAMKVTLWNMIVPGITEFIIEDKEYEEFLRRNEKYDEMHLDVSLGTYAALGFYTGVFSYLFDKFSKPSGFLSKDFEDKYDSVLKIEPVIVGTCYVINVLAAASAGIKYGRTAKFGVEVTSSRQPDVSGVQLSYKF